MVVQYLEKKLLWSAWKIRSCKSNSVARGLEHVNVQLFTMGNTINSKSQFESLSSCFNFPLHNIYCHPETFCGLKTFLVVRGQTLITVSNSEEAALNTMMCRTSLMKFQKFLPKISGISPLMCAIKINCIINFMRECNISLFKKFVSTCCVEKNMF